MFSTIPKVFLISATSTLLSIQCHAQVLNDTSVQGCGRPISTIADGSQPFNSTGTVMLRPGPALGDFWYLSLTITDRRDPQKIYGDSASWQEREGFISIPESWAGELGKANQTEYCMYMLPSLDASSQEKHGDCSGLLSEECMAALQDGPFMSDGQCHKPKNLEDHCGTVSPQGMIMPANFSNTSCTLRKLPHVNISEKYRTYGYLPVSISEGGEDRENFDLYDKHVREAVPMVVSLNRNGLAQHRVVCLAPNNVVEGSRDPTSAAARVSSGLSLVAALAIVALTSML